MATLGPVFTHLCTLGLLTPRDVRRPPRPEEPPPLTEAERFRAMVELATSMAGDLGFASRVRMQLQIEKAQGARDLTDVVQLLYRNLAEQGKKTPLLALQAAGAGRPRNSLTQRGVVPGRWRRRPRFPKHATIAALADPSSPQAQRFRWGRSEAQRPPAPDP